MFWPNIGFCRCNSVVSCLSQLSHGALFACVFIALDCELLFSLGTLSVEELLSPWLRWHRDNFWVCFCQAPGCTTNLGTLCILLLSFAWAPKAVGIWAQTVERPNCGFRFSGEIIFFFCSRWRQASSLYLSFPKMVFCFYFHIPLYWGHRRSQPYAEISHYLGRGSPKFFLLSPASQKTICIKVSCVSQTLGRKTDFGIPLSPRLPDLISCLASGRILFFLRLNKFIYLGEGNNHWSTLFFKYLSEI